MSFSDPLSVTINAVAVPLPKVSTGVNTSSYSKDDGTVKVTVAHTYGKRVRRTIRIDTSKIAPDPFVANLNMKVGSSVYIVVDSPLQGMSNTEMKLQVQTLTDLLSASSFAATLKLLGGEN